MNAVLYTNHHSVFSLHYHLILVVKYRRKVINDRISCRLREMFASVGETY
ncbi:MAG: transposase, partial [Lachnospiraceae bacterium]|nr:transposase [Lachnospiraceae bacterium]